MKERGYLTPSPDGALQFSSGILHSASGASADHKINNSVFYKTTFPLETSLKFGHSYFWLTTNSGVPMTSPG